MKYFRAIGSVGVYILFIPWWLWQRWRWRCQKRRQEQLRIGEMHDAYDEEQRCLRNKKQPPPTNPGSLE